MNDDAKQFMDEHGVSYGDDGIPVQGFTPGLPVPCVRCGVMAEGSGETAVFSIGPIGSGKTRKGGICVDCFRLQFTDGRAFWDGFPKLEGN